MFSFGIIAENLKRMLIRDSGHHYLLAYFYSQRLLVQAQQSMHEWF